MKNFTIFLIIVGLAVAGFFVVTNLNEKTSQNIQTICEANGWTLNVQNSGELTSYSCWKAQNPLIVKDNFKWSCNNDEFVYYYEFRDLNQFQKDEPVIFNFIKSNCVYVSG